MKIICAYGCFINHKNISETVVGSDLGSFSHVCIKEAQDFTSVWDLLDLLFAEILQFVSQLTDRFSHAIKRGERTEGNVGFVCRFRRSWERLETLQKTQIKTHHLHTSANNLHYIRSVRLL